MKAKKFNKKLVLNKATISNLNVDEVKTIKGGEPETIRICPITWGDGSCPTGCETEPGPGYCPPVWYCV
jgi:hypothetical protein